MCSVKKVFLEMSQNSQETPVPESFFNKVASLRPKPQASLESDAKCFPVNFAKSLRMSFF